MDVSVRAYSYLCKQTICSTSLEVYQAAPRQIAGSFPLAQSTLVVEVLESDMTCTGQLH